MLSIFYLMGNVCAMTQTFPYVRDWGTYYGNKITEQQDAVVDSAGNV